MRRYCLLFLLCFSMVPFAQAQEDSASTNNGKKPWMLTLGTDFKLRNIQGGYNFYYQGEYQNNSGELSWVERRQKLDDLMEFGRFYDIKADVLLSRNRNTKVGLSYNFGILTYDADTVYEDEFGNRYPYVYQR